MQKIKYEEIQIVNKENKLEINKKNKILEGMRCISKYKLSQINIKFININLYKVIQNY